MANVVDPVKLYLSLRVECSAAEIVGREHVDLIHSCFAWPRGYGGQLAKVASGVPLIAGLRGSDINILPQHEYGSRLDPSFDRAVRRLLRVADRTISNSQFVRRQAVALGAPPDRADTILKGVRLDKFTGIPSTPGLRESLGLGPAPVVLAVSGLVAIKGLLDVLQAMALVQARGADFQLVVCGDGPERPALEARAKTLELSSRIRFVGRVSREAIPDYFASADMLVHGALIEAAGNVLLEAMSAGLPVVCTDAGGPSEYVLDGITGFVVPVAEPATMAERALRLLASPAMRLEFGARGRERVRTTLSYDRMIDQTMDVYDKVYALQRALGSHKA
jgi:glycosyltransferase involved in cell wall biosynthesis